MLPGNPRYQPKALRETFGYENLYKEAIRVELTVLETLGDIGVIPKKDMKLLTPTVKEKVFAITTSQIDKLEREVTKHDVRALVHLIQDKLPKSLRPWVHVPLTSNDVLSTSQALLFKKAHNDLKPLLESLIKQFASITEEHANTLQVGRTHGQHALPITVGFWTASILNRVISNAKRMDDSAEKIAGKLSGAVGSYNAQVALSIEKKSGRKTFEGRVLEKLGLHVAPISTQISPPEPLADYLFATTLLSATLAQFGRDCRHLMRSEIGEVAEEFAKGQVGSSTMAHKRNPISFENLEGMYLRTKNEFGKLLDTLISEHQRDLVGSSVVRDYPIITVNVAQQLETLLRKDKAGKSFLERMTFDTASLNKNFELNASKMMAEPVYIAMQMAGYKKDAHELVNHRALQLVNDEVTLVDAIELLAQSDKSVREAFNAIPEYTKKLLKSPKSYTGNAQKKALQIVALAHKYLKKAS